MNVIRKSVTAAVLAVACAVAGAPASVAAVRDLSASLPTRAEMRTARITGADLPASYRRDYFRSDSSSTSTSSDPRCSRKLELLNTSDSDGRAPRRVSAKFRMDRTTGPFVGSTVAAWRSKRPAADGLAAIRSLLRACDRWTEVAADGSKGTVRLSRIAMPRLGSDRVAVRARITVRQGQVSVTARVDVGVVRVRNAVTMVTVASFGRPEGVNLVDLTRLSADRLRAVV